MDIGGGQGLLLKEILHACPSARGVLFDQPHIIASAERVPAELGGGASLLREASLKVFLIGDRVGLRRRTSLIAHRAKRP